MLFIGLLEGTKTMDQAIDTIARLNKAIVNLPDDIIINIYTKILKKYRLIGKKKLRLNMLKLINYIKFIKPSLFC